MWPPRTLAITDPVRLQHADADARVVGFAAGVAAAGVDAVQLRARSWPDARMFVLTTAVVAALRGSGCRVFVNDRAHVAWAGGAHGVHLPGHGMHPSRVRRVSAPGLLIGRSVHLGDAPADTADADVALFGSVFRSVSKPAGAPVAGLRGLARMARQPGMPPVLAVGGITRARCEAVREAGARGVAAIDLFVLAFDAGPATLAATVREIHEVFAEGERSA